MKSSKSKTDLINNYLTTKNFIKNEKYRKGLLTTNQYLINNIINSEVSRVNSFSFSNIFNLSGNPSLVDQQFMKLLTFVQSQNSAVRSDLENLIPPLLCHLHVELLKGKDWVVVGEFLKKYSSLLGLEENCSDEKNQFLTMLSEDTKSTFVELIKELLTIQKYQDIENNNLAVNFRCCKYQTKISDLKTLKLLKAYLSNNGHVFILQTLCTWIHIDLSLEDESDEELSEATFYDQPSDSALYKNNIGAKIKIEPENGIKVEEEFSEFDPQFEQKYQNKQLIDLEYSFEKFNSKYQYPVKVLNLCNTENNLSSVNIDKNFCHLAAGFEDSKIVLWSLNSSENYGRKPYRLFEDRLCKWSINNCNRLLIDDFSDFSSDDEEFEGPNESRFANEGICEQDEKNDQASSSKRKRMKSSARMKNQTSIRQKWQNYTFRSSSENSFSNASITLYGHRNAVTDLMFSDTNDVLLSVSRDTTLRVWNAESYKCSAVYRGHNYPIWCVSESSNGNYMATGSKDTTARLWSYERKFPVKTFVGHAQDVDCIDFHPNGSYVATGSTDTTIRLWCITSGKVMRIFTECHLPVNTIKFSPDGQYLAAGGDETKIRIFDLASGQQLMDLKKNNTSPTKCVSWSADSKKLLSGCTDGSYFVWKINAHETNSPSKSKSTSNDKRGSAGSSHNSSSAKAKPYSLLQSNYLTGCKRLLKVIFDSSNTFINCIGNDAV